MAKAGSVISASKTEIRIITGWLYTYNQIKPSANARNISTSHTFVFALDHIMRNLKILIEQNYSNGPRATHPYISSENIILKIYINKYT